ncbi:hypothetical protein RRG08_016110 [Elysia crispata]|uniref:Uncharacterized protein n=1 Tax=Elysia crispata TaxID=231223 RepID=A0AAE0ZNI3_9GAST|nr:hypothetical protein RRG08_016110 [Elysia crispata]
MCKADRSLPYTGKVSVCETHVREQQFCRKMSSYVSYDNSCNSEDDEDVMKEYFPTTRGVYGSSEPRDSDVNTIALFYLSCLVIDSDVNTIALFYLSCLVIDSEVNTIALFYLSCLVIDSDVNTIALFYLSCLVIDSDVNRIALFYLSCLVIDSDVNTIALFYLSCLVIDSDVNTIALFYLSCLVIDSDVNTIALFYLSCLVIDSDVNTIALFYLSCLVIDSDVNTVALFYLSCLVKDSDVNTVALFYLSCLVIDSGVNTIALFYLSCLVKDSDVKVMLKICTPGGGQGQGEQGSSFLSADPRKKQVTVFDPSASGYVTSANRKAGTSAPKMFAFDSVFTPDDSLVHVCLAERCSERVLATWAPNNVSDQLGASSRLLETPGLDPLLPICPLGQYLSRPDCL